MQRLAIFFFFTFTKKTSLNVLEHVFCFNVQAFLEDRYLEGELQGHRICTPLVLPSNTKPYCIRLYSHHKCISHYFTPSPAFYLFFSVHHLNTLPYFFICLFPAIFLWDFNIMLIIFLHIN